MKSRLAIVHFSGGSDSTYAAAVMAERCERVHLLTYDRITFIGARDYSTKNYERLCRIYGPEKFVRRIIPVDDLHARLGYENYFRNLRRHGTTVAALCFSKLAMFWASALYARKHGIGIVADGSVPYMALYPDQNPAARGKLAAFFARFGIDYETPAAERPEDVESLLYAKGIATSPSVRGTSDDLQVFYMEQVLLAAYLKFHLTVFGRRHYDDAVARLYEDKLDWIAGKIQEDPEAGLEL